MLLALLYAVALQPALAHPSITVAEVRGTVSQAYPAISGVIIPELRGVPSTVVACAEPGAELEPVRDARVHMLVVQPSDQLRSTRRRLRKQTGERGHTLVTLVIRDRTLTTLQQECTVMANGGQLLTVQLDLELTPELRILDPGDLELIHHPLDELER